MKPADIGIDVAIAKSKHLPVVVCVWDQGRLVPQPIRHLGLVPPRGRGNVAALDVKSVVEFAREAATYVATVCSRLELTPTRIGIDAPSAPCGSHVARRAAESALDKAGISCFTTPSAQQFERIRTKVTDHLSAGGAVNRIPHANQLWMLVGFAMFTELSRLAPCLEVFPQATARAIGAAQVHKSRPGAVETQLSAAAAFTGWPLNRPGDCKLKDIAWGASHDQLDAYLSAWVASLEDNGREALGHPPDDVIWVPRIDRSHLPSAVAQPTRPVNPESGRTPLAATLLCPACGEKQFSRWLLGWDAHAAHACRGLDETDPTERKAEFRRRFAQHFRR